MQFSNARLLSSDGSGSIPYHQSVQSLLLCSELNKWKQSYLKECVLKGCIPDIEYRDTENKNKIKKRIKLTYWILPFPMLFLSLKKSEIPKLLDLFQLLHYHY